jgi:hypothetical protein
MKEDTVEQMFSDCGFNVKDPSKLQHKTITKIAEKVVKAYGLNPDDYPDVFNRKNIAGLYYLIRMKCKEERDATCQSYCEKWDNLIEAAIAGKSRLPAKLVHKLSEMGNVSGACKYAVKYYISPDKFPPNVRDELRDYVRLYKDHRNCDAEKRTSDQSDKEETNNPTEDWKEEVSDSFVTLFSITTGFVTQEEAGNLEDEYYKLNLRSDKIILVDTINCLKSLSQNLFTSAKVIGFDAEWKPVLCRVVVNRTGCQFCRLLSQGKCLLLIYINCMSCPILKML